MISESVLVRGDGELFLNRASATMACMLETVVHVQFSGKVVTFLM